MSYLFVVAKDVVQLDIVVDWEQLAKERSIEVAPDRYFLEDRLSEYEPKEDKQLWWKFFIDVLIPLEFVHDIVGFTKLKDASRLVKHFLYDHVHPFSKQSSGVVDFVTNELNLDFFVHINFLGLN